MSFHVVSSNQPGIPARLLHTYCTKLQRNSQLIVYWSTPQNLPSMWWLGFHGFHPAKSSTIEQTRPKQIRETIAKNERPRRNFRAMHLASTKPLSNKALCHQSLGMVNAGFLEAPWLGTTFVTSTVDCIQQKQCFRYHEFDQILTKWSNLIFLRHSRRPSVIGSHTNTRTRTIWQKFPYTHLSPACWYTWVCLSVTRLNQL